MTSQALKNQTIIRRRTMSLGELFEAASELTRALETIETGDPLTFARILARATGGGYSAAASLSAKLADAANEYRGEAMMRAVDDVVEQLADITHGTRPAKAGRPGKPETAAEAQGREAWAKVRKVLEIKGWPANAIDESIDVATDMVNDGEWPGLFGEEDPVAAEKPATGQEPANVPVICHGCPDDHLPGIENDPRGFPGKLCQACHSEAVHDVESKQAELAEGFKYEEQESGVFVAVRA